MAKCAQLQALAPPGPRRESPFRIKGLAPELEATSHRKFEAATIPLNRGINRSDIVRRPPASGCIHCITLPVVAIRRKFTTSLFFGRTNPKTPLSMVIWHDRASKTRASLMEISYTKSG